ncbi:hypothetical protein Tco_0496266 [Tanacetum coccineum]
MKYLSMRFHAHGCGEDVTPTEVIHDQESSEKGQSEVSTAGATKARDEEIARQWEEEERQRVMSEAKSSQKIDWNDPLVIRPIFEKGWDSLNTNEIEPMDVRAWKKTWVLTEEFHVLSNLQRRWHFPRTIRLLSDIA